MTSGISVCTAERDVREPRHPLRVAREIAAGDRGDAGEDPRRALLVHEAARAVDRIDDHGDLDGGGIGARGQDAAAVGAEPLGDQQAGPFAADLGEAFDQHRLGHAIDREHGVAALLGDDLGQSLERRRRAGGDDLGLDRVVDGADASQELLRVANGRRALHAPLLLPAASALG